MTEDQYPVVFGLWNESMGEWFNPGTRKPYFPSREAALRVRSAASGEPVPRPRPRFGHGVLFDPPPGAPWPLLGCFHPSQQNTFTRRLTPAMLDDVLAQARALAGA